MYEPNGSDNNFPYLLQNRVDANNNPLPIGPVAQMPEQPMPTALSQSIDLSRQAVEDVVNPGLPQDIADPDLSGKAVIALQNRLDQQSYIYQHNFKIAKRRDAEVYAGMATVIHDTPKTLTIQTQDGQTQKVEIMQIVTDRDTGEPVVLNDLTNMEFDVYAEIGHTYANQKQQTREEIGQMMSGLTPQDPMFNILLLKSMELMDGVQFDDVRDYARKQLILQGIREPETEEEMMIVMQAQQSANQPDPAVQIAMLAEQTKNIQAQTGMVKAQNDQANTKIKSFEVQSYAANHARKTDIDAFRAQTDRMAVQVDAQEAGAEINYKNIKALNEKIDAAEKISPFRGRLP